MRTSNSAQAFPSLSHRKRVGERGLKLAISPLILPFSRREKGPKSIQWLRTINNRPEIQLLLTTGTDGHDR